MNNLDRLFGKELSNLLEPSIISKRRNINRFPSKARGISVDDFHKNVQKKLPSQNQSLVPKMQE